MFQKNGYTYLREIDRTTGVVKKSFKLHFKYVDRIQIIDGQVYYVYRPFESTQKKFIYRENIDI
jgi:beta-galactosidase beta subunit